MNPKRKWKLEKQIKLPNWQPLPVEKLTKKAFWTKVDEENFASEFLINNLINKFRKKEKAKEIKPKIEKYKVLSHKSAHNLGLLLGKNRNKHKII